LLYLFIALSFSSCITTGRQQRTGLLLHRNIIKVDDKKVSKDELSDFLRQKPNKRILGLFSFKVWIYESNQPKKRDTKFKKWMRERIGEAPVLIDSSLTGGDVTQMYKHLNNKGYFNAKVKPLVDTLRRKRGNVVFDIKAGKPYYIRNIAYIITDSLINKLVLKDKSNALISKGDQLDRYQLANERDRITKMLKNTGYYMFSKEFLSIKLDSSLNSHQVDIQIIIRGPNGTGDERLTHKQFRIRNFLIYPDYDNLNNTSSKQDTVFYSARKGAGLFDQPHHYYFLQQGPLRIKPQAIVNALLINGGDLYNMDLTTQSYGRLSEIAIYRYVNIDYKLVKSPLNKDSTAFLDCNVQLMRNLAQSYSLEFETTNNGGRLGIGGNITYKNLSIFKGGETFYIKLNGAAEVQPSIVQSQTKFLFFNTIETGIESGITFPKILFPYSQLLFSGNYRPKTTIQTGFNMQERPDYNRYITNLSLNYEWKSSSFITHNFAPFELNSVRIINPSADFTTYLNQLDPRFKTQYTDHFILAMRYSFLYNTQQSIRTGNFMYFRFSAESAGNTLNFLHHVFNEKTDADGYRTFFNIKYAQYARTDFDFRYYSYKTNKRAWVLRTALGIGIPYGNSSSLPFEKAFFVGGANDMRGWPLRSLGPGSYYDPTNRFDKSGDLQLESNIEYRFPVYDFINGALFTDAGNVWLLNSNKDFPGGEFSSRFMKQIAVDAGMGIRFDFGFFVLRIDGAIPLRYPYLNDNHNWADLTKTKLKNINWNFAIGYPFQ
jgi:outer membrane protein assembly factor BamA